MRSYAVDMDKLGNPVIPWAKLGAEWAERRPGATRARKIELAGRGAGGGVEEDAGPRDRAAPATHYRGISGRGVARAASREADEDEDKLLASVLRQQGCLRALKA